jgi:hypothetical protein
MLTWGPIAIYEAAGAQTFGELMTAVRSQDNGWSKHMSPGKVVGPAVFINRYGQGQTILAPAMVDAAFIQRYRMTEHRDLIRNFVRHLNPDPEVLVDAPHAVETMIARDRQRNRLLIHLVSFAAPPTATSASFDKGRQVLPPVMEEPMEYVARIRIKGSFVKAGAASPASRVEVRGPQITVATNQIHEVVAIQRPA